MSQQLTKRFFKRSLNAHSWLGIMIGGFMYLICLSGTIAVYFEEFERWEQPSVEEYRDYDIDIINTKFNQVLSDGEVNITPHMYVTLPTDANPRVAIITENEGWFINKDGSIASSTDHPWTNILTDLHLYLHLPESWGMIFVSMLGVMLLGLIISGFASHRTLFKDAFKFRLFGAKQLEQTDIHNRLSVWGSPFHLMIAVTGAYFGLAMLVVYLYAFMFANNDIEGVTEIVFGQEPALEQTVGPINLSKAFNQMPSLAPGTQPQFAIIHDTGTPQQFIEIYSYYPSRLIYSDNFVFDAGGNFLQRDGFSDGILGKQIVYSMYRLHFGHFGGWWTKAIYLILGLALTIISVSGINVWLAKRKHRDAINDIWAGFVWGTPVALILPAITVFSFGFISNSIFWGALFLCCLYSCLTKNEEIVGKKLKRLFSMLCVILIAVYYLKFGGDALSGIALKINSFILLTGIVIFCLSKPRLPFQRINISV